MTLALFRVRRRLLPKAGVVEFRPLRSHGLARPTAGEHGEADAVGRRRRPIGRQGVTERGELGGAEETLVAFLGVALHAFAGISLRLVAPRLVLAFRRLERQRE